MCRYIATAGLLILGILAVAGCTDTRSDFTVWLVGKPGHPPLTDPPTEVMQAITAVAGSPRVVRVWAEDFASRYKLHVVQRSKPPPDLIVGENFLPFIWAAWAAKESGPPPNRRELDIWLQEQSGPVLGPPAVLTSGFLHKAADFVLIVEGSSRFAEALRLAQTMAPDEPCTAGVKPSDLPGRYQDSALGSLAEKAAGAYVRGDGTALKVLSHARLLSPSRITWKGTVDDIHSARDIWKREACGSGDISRILRV